MSAENYRDTEMFPHKVRLPSPEGFPAIRHIVVGRGSEVYSNGTEILIFAGNLPHLGGEPQADPQSGGEETRVLVRRNGTPDRIEEVIPMKIRSIFPRR